MAAALVVLLWSLALAGTLAAQQESTVNVRTYDYTNLTAGNLADARAEADRIFRNARIAVRWIDCWVPGKPGGAPCTEPLAAGKDLMLRLVDRMPSADAPTARISPLGESMVDREQRGGVLMTVDVFPVHRIADRTSTSASLLLGRAIAHEIGHLLLGSADHARLGLMRPFWSHDELRGSKPADWGFSSREAAQMRQTLRGRSRTAD